MIYNKVRNNFNRLVAFYEQKYITWETGKYDNIKTNILIK